MHSSAEQNLSYNFETLHHARAVKSSIVVIFEDTKHIVEILLRVLWQKEKKKKKKKKRKKKEKKEKKKEANLVCRLCSKDKLKNISSKPAPR